MISSFKNLVKLIKRLSFENGLCFVLSFIENYMQFYIWNKIYKKQTNTQPQYAKPQPMKKPMLGLVSHHENQESTRDKPHNHTEDSHVLQDNQEQVGSPWCTWKAVSVLPEFMC